MIIIINQSISRSSTNSLTILLTLSSFFSSFSSIPPYIGVSLDFSPFTPFFLCFTGLGILGFSTREAFYCSRCFNLASRGFKTLAGTYRLSSLIFNSFSLYSWSFSFTCKFTTSNSLFISLSCDSYCYIYPLSFFSSASFSISACFTCSYSFSSSSWVNIVFCFDGFIESLS